MSETDIKRELELLKQQNAALQAEVAKGTTGPQLQVSKVAPKIPPFWPHRVKYWFVAVEAQFEIAGIVSDATKFSYVIGNLDAKFVHEIEDIITNPPPSGSRYEKTKDLLVKRFSLSEESRVKQLLDGEELGDRKPSQFLRHLRALAGTTIADDTIIRQLWTRRLPDQVRAILASHPDLALEKLADLADNIIEVFSPAQVALCATTSAPTPTFEQKLTQRLDDLCKQVASLTADRHRTRTRNRSASSGRRSRVATPAKSGMCWYHRKFAEKATKCTKPCNWTGNSSSNQ